MQNTFYDFSHVKKRNSFFEMAAREESTFEGGLSARCISLLKEVKEISEDFSNPAATTTTNGDETSARRNASEGAQTRNVIRKVIWITPRSQFSFELLTVLFKSFLRRVRSKKS